MNCATPLRSIEPKTVYYFGAGDSLCKAGRAFSYRAVITHKEDFYVSNRPTDNHHIISRATCKRLGINPNFTGNIVRVKTGKHRAWHQLFGSQTPDEAIATIEAEWSLSKEGQAEFNRLTNVRIFARRKAK